MKAEASSYDAVGVLVPLWYTELAEVVLDNSALGLVFREVLPLWRLPACARFLGEERPLPDSALEDKLSVKES